MKMIVLLKTNTRKEQMDRLIQRLENLGVTVHVSMGESHTILGLVGDTSRIDIDMISPWTP
jgi:3-deoxy-7-phosphoheptulonate synthase